jgi:hypothetical protein
MMEAYGSCISADFADTAFRLSISTAHKVTKKIAERTENSRERQGDIRSYQD